MAYSNWGAIVISEKENRKLRENCDTTYYWINNKWEKGDADKDYPESTFSIGSHAILFNDKIVLQWYKRYFPTVSINNNGVWEEINEKDIIDNLIKNNKINYYDLEYHCKYDKNKNEFYVDYYNFNDIVNNLELYGIKLDKIDYDYFDLWNITWSNGNKYHIIIGQSLGKGFDKTYLTNFINRHGWFDGDGFYFDTNIKTDYIIRQSIKKDNRKNEWYWIKDYFITGLKNLFKLKFRLAFYNFKISYEKLRELKYVEF